MIWYGIDDMTKREDGDMAVMMPISVYPSKLMAWFSLKNTVLVQYPLI